MRLILAIVAASFVLVGCNGETTPEPAECTPKTMVTKTGVVETCV